MKVDAEMERSAVVLEHYELVRLSANDSYAYAEPLYGRLYGIVVSSDPGTLVLGNHLNEAAAVYEIHIQFTGRA
jgi:hypothetical protein